VVAWTRILEDFDLFVYPNLSSLSAITTRPYVHNMSHYERSKRVVVGARSLEIRVILYIRVSPFHRDHYCSSAYRVAIEKPSVC